MLHVCLQASQDERITNNYIERIRRLYPENLCPIHVFTTSDIAITHENITIHRYTQNAGKLSVLLEVLHRIDGDILFLSSDIILNDTLLMLYLKGYLNSAHDIIAVSGWSLDDSYEAYRICVPSDLIYDSIIDIRYGILLKRKVLNVSLFDIDDISYDFNGCEEIYLSYILSQLHYPVHYIKEAWKVIMIPPIPHSLFDPVKHVQRNILMNQTTDNSDSFQRGILKLMYLKFNHEYPKYYITFTSFPKRLCNLPLLIESLKRQRKWVYAINMWIEPDEWTDNDMAILCQICSGVVNIIHNTCGERWKSYNKFFPHALHGYYGRFAILTIDDDIYYPNDFLEKILSEASRYCFKLPYANSVMRSKPYYISNSNIVQYCDSISTFNVIEGVFGAYYPSDVLCRLNKADLRCPDMVHYKYCDDVYISVLLARSGIPVATNPSLTASVMFDWCMPMIQPLWEQNRGENGNNFIAITALLSEYVDYSIEHIYEPDYSHPQKYKKPSTIYLFYSTNIGETQSFIDANDINGYVIRL